MNKAFPVFRRTGMGAGSATRAHNSQTTRQAARRVRHKQTQKCVHASEVIAPCGLAVGSGTRFYPCMFWAGQLVG